MEFTVPETHCVLVTNDGTKLTNKLIASLKNEGNKVVVLNLAKIPNPINEEAISLTDSADASVESAISEIQNNYGKIGAFIHLHPHFEFQAPKFTQHFQVERDIVKTVFLIAKHIQKDLNALGLDQRANFLTCTRMDGMLGQGRRGNTSIVGGGLTGLVKCLNLEWSSVFCRAIDIQPELSSKKISNHILAEFHDPDRSIIEVAYSEEGRKTTSAEPSEVKENHLIFTKVKETSVFLVSGGAKGVTAKCVIEMAKSFPCKFILLGRSSMDIDIPDFAKKENDETTLKRLIMDDMNSKGEKPSLPKVKSVFKNIIAKKEIEETLSAIKSHGNEVTYIKGDVTNPASYKSSLDKATDKLGQITGIIHGAGRLADKYIQDKTEDDLRNVLSVKLDGLLSLLNSVDIDQLKHLILFSSVAGFYGNVGQTDYAIANEILSKAAHLFKTNHPDTHVSAINWGAWDSGMVSGELKAQLESAGISLVNSEGGAAMLVNELNSDYSGLPQVIIGDTLPEGVSHIGDLRTHRIHRVLKLKNNPFLNHHKIQDKPVLPVVNAMGWMAQSCEMLYPDYTVYKVENATLYKGLIFDEKQNEDYVLELKELEKDQEFIVFQATVFSEGKKLPTNHYRANITLVNKNSVPEPPVVKHQISGNQATTNGQVLYEDGSLFHSEYFQGIKEILECSDDRIVMSCSAMSVPLSDQGQFPVKSINTYFLDIQYQGMVVWVQRHCEGAKSLPLRTDSAVLYRPIPFDKELYVEVSVKYVDDSKMEAVCTVYDKKGLVYIKTSGAAVTISKQLVW